MIQINMQVIMHKCIYCSEIFSRRDYLKRHNDERHNHIRIRHYYSSRNCTHQDTQCLPQIEKNGIKRSVLSTYNNGTTITIRFAQNNVVFPAEFFENVQEIVNETLEIFKSEKYKVITKLCVEFESLKNDNEKHESYFTYYTTHLSRYDFEIAMSNILQKIETYEMRGSSWTISNTLFLDLTLIKTKYSL